MCVCVHVCVCFLAQGLEAHARMALSLPSPSVSKTITVASAMPAICCAVGNAKVYCFGVVCDESHSSAQQGWCLPYHAKTHIISTYYINISARVLQPATCLKPRSTRPGARLRRAKRGTVSAMASAQVRSRERSVGCEPMIVTNHGVERGLCLDRKHLLTSSICDFSEHTRAEA